MVEEATKLPPRKSKKKNTKMKDEVGASKVVAQEMTPSFITCSKRKVKAHVGSPLKTLAIPKKSKGKKKVLKPRDESMEHVDFCSSSELGDGDSLLVLLLNNQGRGIGGQASPRTSRKKKPLETQEGEVNQMVVNKMSKKLLKPWV
jgi:hypothetical protein